MGAVVVGSMVGMLKSGLALIHSMHSGDLSDLPLAISSLHLRGMRVPAREVKSSDSLEWRSSKLESKKWRFVGMLSSDWAWALDAVRAVQIAIVMGLSSNIFASLIYGEFLVSTGLALLLLLFCRAGVRFTALWYGVLLCLGGAVKQHAAHGCFVLSPLFVGWLLC